MDLDHVGATFGPMHKPTKFICLVLKMLQLSPEKEIVLEFVKNEDYKYVRALGAFYLRLAGRPVDIHRYLEPLYNDYRKLRVRTPQGTPPLAKSGWVRWVTPLSARRVAADAHGRIRRPADFGVLLLRDRASAPSQAPRPGRHGGLGAPTLSAHGRAGR